MTLLDAFRCVAVAVASGIAYGTVLFRRLILRQSHPLGWPVDIEVCWWAHVLSDQSLLACLPACHVLDTFGS